ncbi:MAG: succinyl-diaminopimelate desuccinylase [Rhodobacteraceae bacterium HLUCCA08]|nr:MAG: succinyl-diaminopimelate desuccinylase [Rhodobacteraceae bacterium HLUCCA08]
MPDPVDPVALTAALIRCPSVTPQEGGALVLLEELLSGAGFDCTRVDRNGTPNLFARWGAKGANRSLGFNGHTDVVPVGDAAAWTTDPFGAEIKGGVMYGRGATDMKSGVAAFAAAAVDFVRDTPPDGAVILTITGDEEGPGTDGTLALLDWMADQGERMAACLVGEPTCVETMGDMIKIGRRGSMSAWVTVTGKQGHSAYPHRARNPVPAMARLMDRLATHRLDDGTDHFDPSTLAVVAIDTGNPATNVIPARCTGAVNIRFNDRHTGASLSDWLRAEAAAVAEAFEVQVAVEIKVSGEAFLTPPGALSALVAGAVAAETGIAPVLSTTGGTSDARFVKDHCPVVEFGLVGRTMHQVDECVPVDQIARLKAVYGRILRDYFA